MNKFKFNKRSLLEADNNIQAENTSSKLAISPDKLLTAIKKKKEEFEKLKNLIVENETVLTDISNLQKQVHQATDKQTLYTAYKDKIIKYLETVNKTYNYPDIAKQINRFSSENFKKYSADSFNTLISYRPISVKTNKDVLQLLDSIKKTLDFGSEQDKLTTFINKVKDTPGNENIDSIFKAIKKVTGTNKNSVFGNDANKDTLVEFSKLLKLLKAIDDAAKDLVEKIDNYTKNVVSNRQGTPAAEETSASAAQNKADTWAIDYKYIGQKDSKYKNVSDFWNAYYKEVWKDNNNIKQLGRYLEKELIQIGFSKNPFVVFLSWLLSQNITPDPISYGNIHNAVVKNKLGNDNDTRRILETPSKEKWTVKEHDKDNIIYNDAFYNLKDSTEQQNLLSLQKILIDTGKETEKKIPIYFFSDDKLLPAKTVEANLQMDNITTNSNKKEKAPEIGIDVMNNKINSIFTSDDDKRLLLISFINNFDNNEIITINNIRKNRNFDPIKIPTNIQEYDRMRRVATIFNNEISNNGYRNEKSNIKAYLEKTEIFPAKIT